MNSVATSLSLTKYRIAARTALLTMLLMAAATLLAACGREAQSPAEVRENVEQAQREGREDIQEARREAQENLEAAREGDTGYEPPPGAMTPPDADITAGPQGSRPDQIREQAAEGQLEIAKEKAEADYEVAKARCDGLAGDAQQSCVERAERERDARIEAAEAQYERKQPTGGMP